MSKLYIDKNLFDSENTLKGKSSDFNLQCVQRQVSNGQVQYNLYFPRTGSSNFKNIYSYYYDSTTKDYILTWTSETNSLPSTCVNIEMTQNVFYRNDIVDILICFFIISLVCFYFPFKIVSRAFGRWLKI